MSTTTTETLADRSDDGERRGGLIGRFDRFQQAHSWAAFAFAVVKKFGDDRAGRLAALIAYYTFFSLFPLLLALVTVLGFVLAGSPELQQRILDSALAQFPVIGEELRRNVGNLSRSGLALTVGLAGLLWAGMATMQAWQQAMNAVWDVPIKHQPRFVASRLRSLVMLALLGGGLLGTTLLAGVGTSPGQLGAVARVGVAALGVVLNVALFLVAFKVLTSIDRPWRTFLPGAVIAGVAWAVLQAVGGYYVTNQLQGASNTYGMFAIVIGLLTWLHLQAQATLLAAEVNVVRDRNLWPRGLVATDLTDADRRVLLALAKVEERIPEESISMHLPPRSDPNGSDGSGKRGGDDQATSQA